MKPGHKKTKSVLHAAMLGAALALSSGLATGQNIPVVTGEPRVDKLLGQMTLEEKLTLIHGTHEDPATDQGQAGYLGAIPRLGIPGLRFADGPPGVLTRHPSQAATATVGVAATFSVKDAEQNGVVIGRQARALGIDVALLLGKTSPAGRLPVTWARRLEDYAATDPKHPERSKQGVDGKTTFSEGVNVGYRWFDREKITPLFPFGHGLSYTTFAYSGLRVDKASDGGLNVQVTIRNIGNTDSDEVPQVYLSAPKEIPAGVQFPVRALAAFDRVSIPAGESRTVTLHVTPRQLQSWSTAAGKWVTSSGQRTVSVGASSRDLRLEATIG